MRADFPVILSCILIWGCQTKKESSPSAERPATPPVLAKTLAEAVANARPGDVIVLPAGTFEAGITLPPGVGLRGAGANRTILDARKTDVGIRVEGGRGAEIADLTVTGATRTDLLVHGAEETSVRRVRTTASLNGVNFADVARGRIENVVSDNNRYGIVVSGGRDNVVVNCTLARNASLGLSLPSGEGTVAFNNCLAECATGVLIGASARGARLDHNLYYSLFIGKLAGQVGRKSIGPWRSLSGQDVHSLEHPIAFRDPKSGDFRASNHLEWALDRAATSDWGTAELAGIKAPETDIEGSARLGRYDIGAYEVALMPARPPDGRLLVRDDEGTKSAGLFAPGGTEVSYLFHNLPLARGSHPFWFPARDFQGRTIPSGTYELKSVESALEWEYIHWVGDSGEAFPLSRSASVKPFLVAFDDDGRLVLGQGWSEDATNLRGFEVSTGRWLWAVGGASDLSGLEFHDGAFIMLKPSGDQASLTRVDPESGKIRPFPGSRSGTVPIEGGAKLSGLAILDGRLHAADTAANALWSGPIERPALSPGVKVAAPSSLSADASTHRLWVISQERRVKAIDPAGTIVADLAPVEAPAALAARGGRLAIASRKSGKVHIYEARDPKRLVPIATVGTGDGPYGPYQPDRFHFQSAPGEPGSYVNLALGPKGELAVVEENRLLVFGPDGKPLWSTFGEFGNFTALAHDDPERLWDTEGRKSLRLKEKSGTWAPEAYWNVPRGAELLGTFSEQGITFGACVTHGPMISNLLILRFDRDGFSARPVLLIFRDEKTNKRYARKDKNHDGRLDDSDGSTLLPPPDGPGPFRDSNPLHRSFSFLQANGDVLTLDINNDTWGAVWKRSGLDADSVPVYRLQDARAIARNKGALISPYDGKPDETHGLAGATPTDDGGTIALANLNSAPGGTGLINRAGTDAIGLAADGRVRWLHPLGQHKGLEGWATVGPVTITGVGTTAEIIGLNRDGMGLGSFGPPAQVHYAGYFLDHPQAVRAYRGRDGRIHALIADNYGGMQHWFRLRGEDRINAQTAVVTLKEPAAKALAALPAPRFNPGAAKPPPPIVRVPRLTHPFPIDGDPAKWRAAGIVPQVIITPETANGAIDGPRDVSSIVRLAYHDNDLYLQFLTFDDVPVFHQPAARHHLQDGVEFCINGYLPGFKFDVTRTTDAGEILIRSRFYFAKLDYLVPPEVAPRIVKILDDARSVPERELIESVYGVEMADCRVIVTEFKLPIDERTYKDSLKELFPLKPGQAFRIGFLINDNDDPGTDVQNYLVWPATYGTFNPVEDGAIAVLE